MLAACRAGRMRWWPLAGARRDGYNKAINRMAPQARPTASSGGRRGLPCGEARAASGLVVLHLDELFRAFAGFFDQAIQALLAAFQHGIGDTLGVQRDGLGRVVVTGDDVVDPFGRM